ncbi:sugar phosphate isomerase/epimerase family protein [Protaetiibacter mangrovi]|uniref:Sugar phosphate isomerase/epimerase n=1 Tax=Protaetiibacter mangrovi TaxID=2970926 RepID=A0ABT1ZHV1_9MICO|nr:sugar phosphate isomerase/epimerase [Protaetiibacter mangrovi]MCS0500270.1 sugar phosphate isomerase/epimerase [Protaetiibacter mangrovi]TPX05143.1 sugar phosphate isomerase/epimerase [Schumannella luteola]
MISVGMSTTCVYPFAVEHAFRIARMAGFDSMEIMVTNDPVTQDATKLLEISERYGLPITAIHAPVLLLTTFVWGRDPQVKLEKSGELAAAVGADAVVVHPPFRWQSGYAQNFERIVRQTAKNSGVEVAVENMFPWTVKGRSMKAYSPSPDPLDLDVDHMTLDFSHASLSGRDSLEMAMAMGPKLRHIHLCDGATSAADGAILDEHLLPGEGTQPVAETLQYLASIGWDGNIVAEVNVRQEKDEQYRLEKLVQTVAFAREHLSQEHATREPIEGGRGDLPLKIRQARRHEKKSAKPAR